MLADNDVAPNELPSDTTLMKVFMGGFFEKKAVSATSQQIRTSCWICRATNEVFSFFFVKCNLLDNGGSKAVLRGPSAGSKVQLLSRLSVPLTLVVNQTSRRGHRSKCLGSRVTPQAEHGQDFIRRQTLNYRPGIGHPRIIQMEISERVNTLHFLNNA